MKTKAALSELASRGFSKPAKTLATVRRGLAESAAGLTKPRAKTPPTVTRRIWTYGHRPFVMGGSVDYLLACDLPCTGPHKLGKGYSGYLATAPNGKTFVAEAKTGAIVGPTLEDVRADIGKAKPKVMREQVAKAAQEMTEAHKYGSFEVKDAAFFWDALRCGGQS